MRDCYVPVEWYSFTFVLLCLILSFAYTVNASGAYMQALRARRNHTKSHGGAGDSSDGPGSIYDFGAEAQLPQLTESPHLEVIDERYSICNGIDIREITILQIQELFATKKLTSAQLTQCYIERIRQMNKVLKAVIEVNPDALAGALRADLERSFGKKNLGMMHGIPVLIKENIATSDMMETTAGSLALVGIRPKDDADFMKTLRKSGAVILGKANLSEFA